MQIVFDYVRGNISLEAFKAEWYANPQIAAWLDSLIDLKSPPKEEWSSLPYAPWRMAIHKHYDGSIVKYILASDTFDSLHTATPKWLDIMWHFPAIASVVVAAYPNIVPTSYYEEEASYFQNAVGDYLGGPEVEDCIANILSSFSRDMGKTKRTKTAKAALRTHFHIHSRQYPHWVQEPEWPMGKHSPMVFSGQKRTGEKVTFTFQDVDTKEIRLVEQYY